MTVPRQIPPTAKSAAARFLPLALIAVVAVTGGYFLHPYISFETLRDNRLALIAFRDAHLALTIAGFLMSYMAIVAFSLPGATLATLTGGFLFGPVLGTFLNVTGATCGAVAIFLAARMGLGRAMKARMDAASGLVARVKRGLDENQWSMLFFIRFVPVVPFFLANLIPAFLAVPLHRFVISTFLGIIPGAVVYTSVGAGLGTVFARGETPNLGIIFEPHILWPILGLCALSILPVVIKVATGKKDLLK